MWEKHKQRCIKESGNTNLSPCFLMISRLSIGLAVETLPLQVLLRRSMLDQEEVILKELLFLLKMRLY